MKTPTDNSADYKQAAAEDLGRMGLAHTQGIIYGPVTGRDSDRTTVVVAAEANDGADRFLRMVVGDRPLSGSVMQAAEKPRTSEPSRCATAAYTPPQSSSYLVRNGWHVDLHYKTSECMIWRQQV